MSREIKFRAWLVKDNKWADELQMAFTSYGFPALITAFDQDTSPDKVDNENIIEQFTGLKDKNGVKIYEGDIVYHDYHKLNLLVSWCKDRAGFYFDGDYAFIDIDSVHLKVIGNIHENHELLEE